MPTDEMISFYDNKFGQKALAKFVSVGKRMGRSPEHTLQAATEVYAAHLDNPFPSNIIIGQKIHGVAARLDREKKKTEVDAWEFLTKLSTPKTFRQKFKNWMQWGKWE